MNKKGRLALLTNVYTGKPIKSEGRGFLVIDYLKGNVTSLEYINTLSKNGKMYSPFNLCLFEPQNNGAYEAVYYKNQFENKETGTCIPGEGPNMLPPGVSGFGNHAISTPFRKTIYGIDEFRSKIEKGLGLEELQSEAVQLLSNKQEHHPDTQMQKQSGVLDKMRTNNDSQKESFEHPDDDASKQLSDQGTLQSNEKTELDFTLKKEQLLSSIFVDIGEKYGTRMQTLIFVGYDCEVHFMERTRISYKAPFEWTTKSVKFQFE